MPNWIEGTLKLRGGKENVKRFFDDGLGKSAAFSESSFKPVEVTDYGRDVLVTLRGEPWIKDSMRAFLEDGDVYVLSHNGEYIACVGIRQAWSFKSDDFVGIAKKYGIDIRVQGFEMGMEFAQDLEVGRDGNIIRDYVKEYDDWFWDCPMPMIGG